MTCGQSCGKCGALLSWEQVMFTLLMIDVKGNEVFDILNCGNKGLINCML